jgi:hypothetical protein
LLNISKLFFSYARASDFSFSFKAPFSYYFPCKLRELIGIASMESYVVPLKTDVPSLAGLQLLCRDGRQWAGGHGEDDPGMIDRLGVPSIQTPSSTLSERFSSNN